MGPSIFIDGEKTGFAAGFRRQRDFNGAVDLHRRRASSRMTQYGAGVYFNGAVDLHRRREDTQPDSADSVTALQWGRRSSSTESDRCAGQRPRHGRLQWGRRSSSTERNLYARGSGQARDTSMGPSIFIDGEATAAARGNGPPRLQWGRRSSSTESPVR